MGLLSRVKERLVDPFTTTSDDLIQGFEQKDFPYEQHEPRNRTGTALSVPGFSFGWTNGKSYSAKAKTLNANSISKSCIQKRATAIGNIDLLVEGNNSVKALLESPNHIDGTLQAALSSWEKILSIGGDLYWFFDLSTPGAPKIYSFRPDFVKNDVQNRVYHYDPSGYFGNGSKPEFKFHYDYSGTTVRCERWTGSRYEGFNGALKRVSYYDPLTASEGAGAGDSALANVDILNAIDRLYGNKFAAGGSKAGFFQMSNRPTDAEEEAIKSQLQAINYGNMNVLPAGMEFNAAQLTFQEMNLLETYEQQAAVVCSAFDVPVELVFQSNATYENERSSDKTFYRNFIGPEAHWLVGQLQAGLRLYVDPKATLSVDETSIQHLEEDNLETITKLAPTGCFTINEIRALRGLPPVEGGEALSSAKVPQGQPEEKPKGPVSFNADAGSRGDKNEQ